MGIFFGAQDLLDFVVDSLDVGDPLIVLYLFKSWLLVTHIAGIDLLLKAVDLGSLSVDFIRLPSRHVGWFCVEDAAFVCGPVLFSFISWDIVFEVVGRFGV